MKKILIVGVENTCRSIIAAEYFKKILKDRSNTGVEVISAGIRAFPDIPAEPEAVAVLKSLGIDDEFRSKMLGRQDVLDADIIVTVNKKIKDAITGKFADKTEVVFTLKEAAGETESGMDISKASADTIKNMVEKSFEKITGV